MRKEKLTDVEIRELRREKRKSLKIGLLFFFVLTVVNLVFYFQDFFLGAEGIKPPVEQLIAGLFGALVVGYLSYRFFASDYSKDISSAEKKICERKVVQKYTKKKSDYLIRLSNTAEVSVASGLFENINIGDSVIIHRAPKSEYVFHVEKKS